MGFWSVLLTRDEVHICFFLLFELQLLSDANELFRKEMKTIIYPSFSKCEIVIP